MHLYVVNILKLHAHYSNSPPLKTKPFPAFTKRPTCTQSGPYTINGGGNFNYKSQNQMVSSLVTSDRWFLTKGLSLRIWYIRLHILDNNMAVVNNEAYDNFLPFSSHVPTSKTSENDAYTCTNKHMLKIRKIHS